MSWRNSKRFFCCLYNQFFDSQCPAHAASLAYATLLSIVPMMLFVFYVLSFIPQLQGASAQLEQFVLHNFVASSAELISKQLQVFTSHIQVLSWTNIAALAFIAVLLVYNMVSAVNHVWQVKLRLSLALSFLVYLLLILLIPLLLGMLLLVTSYLTSLPLLSHAAQISFVRKPLLLLTPFVVEWFIFGVFNALLPSVTVRFRYACVAGLITMVLFELAKVGFVQYLRYFPTYRLVYGALATIPIFLVWIYVSWLVILIGVSVCHILQTKPYVDR